MFRALQQQHKTDRPTHPAAASMLHYAAAAAAQQSQGAVAAASEQYNRLAASGSLLPANVYRMK